ASRRMMAAGRNTSSMYPVAMPASAAAVMNQPDRASRAMAENSASPPSNTASSQPAARLCNSRDRRSRSCPSVMCHPQPNASLQPLQPDVLIADQQQDTTPADPLQQLTDASGGIAVQLRQRLMPQPHRGIARQQPGQPQAAELATGQTQPALAVRCIQLQRQPPQRLPQPHLLQHLNLPHIRRLGRRQS